MLSPKVKNKLLRYTDELIARRFNFRRTQGHITSVLKAKELTDLAIAVKKAREPEQPKAVPVHKVPVTLDPIIEDDGVADPKLLSKWSNRQPVLPSCKVIKMAGPVEQPSDHRCIGCGVEVNTTFARRGRILQGFSKLEKDWTAHTLIPAAPGSDRRHWHHEDKQGKIPLTQYVRGYLCDDCASDYHVESNNRGQSAPRVITDPLTLKTPEEREGTKSYKGFNTRVTQ